MCSLCAICWDLDLRPECEICLRKNYILLDLLILIQHIIVTHGCVAFIEYEKLGNVPTIISYMGTICSGNGAKLTGRSSEYSKSSVYF